MDLCRISGISYYVFEDHWHATTLSVPWDENIAIVDPTSRKTKGKCSLAEAHIPREGRTVPGNKMSGYIVHASCWELLLTHKVWESANMDTKVVLDALWNRCIDDWGDPDGPEFEWTVLDCPYGRWRISLEI